MIFTDRYRLTRTALVVAGMFAGTLITIPALADGSHGHVTSDGRFTPNQAGATFPPQPRAVENVRQFTPLPDGATRRVTKGTGTAVGVSGVTTKNVAGERNEATAAAMADSQVRNLLGQRFAHIKTSAVKDKWDSNGERYQIVFFSHSNNQTISVSFEGGELDDLRAIPASESQPPLAETEMAEAIDLARTHWMNEGNSRISQLVGYAIQTFQSDGSSHATRVVYVSFHVESPDTPELLTWVDLNSRQTIRAEVAQ